MFPPVTVNRVNHPAEHGISVVKLPTTTLPLGPLTSKHKGHPLVPFRCSADFILVKGPESLNQSPAVMNGKGCTNIVMGAAAAEITGQGIQVQRLCLKGCAQLLHAPGQGFRAAGRYGDHGSGLGSQGDGPDALLRRTVLLHHAMTVGPAKAEGVDSHCYRAILRERFTDRLHRHGTG